MSEGRWEFWIDCGGTFTDIVALRENGQHLTHKLLSKSPHYKSSVIEGIKSLMGEEFSPDNIKRVRLGTTVSTNAFLERKGIKCALLTTLGFRDVLEIRRQDRPELFDLDIKKTKPLYDYVGQVKERISSSGEVEIPLDLDIARFELERAKNLGYKSIAISFMHSTVNPKHEIAAGKLAKEIGFHYVSLSHEVSPVSKYIYRTETAVADSYLTPLLDVYTKELEAELGGVEVVYMQSNGGLCAANALKGQNTLLSGPAGGLIGAVQSCGKRGYDKIITFDMGGTSTDVAIYDGKINLNHEPMFHGLKLLAPMMDIHTVAAGGGSILKYDGERFMVGPESAGAYPGPACYRNGGPLTVTDANLILGRLKASQFPKIFGPNRDQGLDEETARRKFEEIGVASGMSVEEVAQGFLEVAANTMARAIKKVSVERGQNPKDFAMVSFGGAAGQMACKVADAIGIEKIFIHPFSSVLSAYGIGHAHESYMAKARVSQKLSELDQEKYDQILEGLKREIQTNMKGGLEFRPSLHMQGLGSDYEITINSASISESASLFSAEYKKIFGLNFNGEIEVVSVSMEGILKSGFAGDLVKGEREENASGPQVLSFNNTSIVLDQGWIGARNQFGEWELERKASKAFNEVKNEKVELEVFYQRFQSIADQMGHTLQSLAHSITIKERNDFSCAIFTSEGELLSNAPHIPVHLGSMGDAVVAVKDAFPEIAKDDAFICNDPNRGGTHLPDITIISPVFLDGEIALFVASRGHHGDVGGISPGSMPGASSKLEEEGIVIPPTRIARKGELEEDMLREILANSKYPARNPDQNIHDIKAQLAANQKALYELTELSKAKGSKKIVEMAERVLSYSHRKIMKTLQKYKRASGSIQIAEDRWI